MKPMLAEKPDRTAEEYVFTHVLEAKLDGFRAMVEVTKEGVVVTGRSGADWSGRMPSVEADLSALPPCILDCEVVVIESWAELYGELVPVCANRKVAAAMKRNPTETPSLVILDVLKVGTYDLTDLPDHQRRGFGVMLEEHLGDSISLVPRWKDWGTDLLQDLGQLAEGGMVKDPDARYQQGKRSKAWLKFKRQFTVDCVVMGVTEGKGSLEGSLGALEVGQYRDGVLTWRCSVGGAMDWRKRDDMWKANSALLGRVVEVRAYAHDKGGEGLRHPQFVRFRDDKMPEECEWEAV